MVIHLQLDNDDDDDDDDKIGTWWDTWVDCSWKPEKEPKMNSNGGCSLFWELPNYMSKFVCWNSNWRNYWYVSLGQLQTVAQNVMHCSCSSKCYALSSPNKLKNLITIALFVWCVSNVSCLPVCRWWLGQISWKQMDWTSSVHQASQNCFEESPLA